MNSDRKVSTISAREKLQLLEQYTNISLPESLRTRLTEDLLQILSPQIDKESETLQEIILLFWKSTLIKHLEKKFNEEESKETDDGCLSSFEYQRNFIMNDYYISVQQNLNANQPQFFSQLNLNNQNVTEEKASTPPIINLTNK